MLLLRCLIVVLFLAIDLASIACAAEGRTNGRKR